MSVNCAHKMSGKNTMCHLVRQFNLVRYLHKKV